MADSRSAKDSRGNPIREVRFGGEAEVSPEEEVGICVIFFRYSM